MLTGIAIVSGTSASAQLRQVAADTGRMTWGHKEYSRYTTADVCDRAVSEVSLDFTRKYNPDTAWSVVPIEETEDEKIPEAVIATARACGARFTVDNTDPRELWSLLRISLYLEDDQQVKAVIERKLSLAETAQERGRDLAFAIYYLMTAPSPRRGMAEGYVKQLEAITPALRVERYNVHGEFLQYWRKKYDVDSIRFHAGQLIELAKAMSPEEQNRVDLTAGWAALLDLANIDGDLNLQQQILDEVLEYVGPWRGGQGERWAQPRIDLLETRKALYGKKTRPLEGKYWFNHDNVPRPVPGKMSVIVKVSHTCGVGCHRYFRMIKRIQQKYGDELDIILVTEMRGYAPGTGPLTPEEEAKHASDYFLNYVKLSVPILVDETTPVTLPDGRIFRERTGIASLFSNWRAVNAILIDRDGVFRWMGELGVRGDDDRLFGAALKRVKMAGTNPSAAQSSDVGVSK